MMRHLGTLSFCLLLGGVAPAAGRSEPQEQPQAVGTVSAQLTTAPLPIWTYQSGSTGTDLATAVATCGGFVYTVGHTDGTLPRQTSAGGRDGFLIKSRASDGVPVWTVQFGTVATDDYATGVAVSHCGSGQPAIYVVGHTRGTFTEPSPTHTGAHQGGTDLFLRKYDAQGQLLWSRQRGTPQDDHAWSAAVSATTGDVYLAGTTSGVLAGTSGSVQDAILVRYQADGTFSRAVQLGSATSRYEQGRGVAVDHLGRVYLAGFTTGTFAGQTSAGGTHDIFLAQYDGTLAQQLWLRQFGTSGTDQAYGVATSRSASGGADVFVVGQVNASLPSTLPLSLGGTATHLGGFDMAAFRFNDAGQVQWATLKGTEGSDSASAVASDGVGNVYISGSTKYDLRSDPSTEVGSTDAVLVKLDVHGALQSVHQYGSSHTDPTSENDQAAGIATDGDLGVYLVGDSLGNIGGTLNQGAQDLYVLRYDDGCSADPAQRCVPPTLRFNTDWTVALTGRPLAGGPLRILYELPRLPQCRGPSWSITGFAMTNHGTIQSFPVANASNLGTVAEATLDLGTGGNLELWFSESDGNGCHAWDSNLGWNFHYKVWQDPTLTFNQDWTHSLFSTIRGGSTLMVDYDIDRLPRCRLGYMDYETWSVHVHYRFDGGPVTSAPVTLGYGEWNLKHRVQVPAFIPVPVGARTLELWFSNSDRGTCVEYDSRYGQNYLFPVQ